MPALWSGFDAAAPGSDQTVTLIKGARAEAMADAAVKYSGHLDRLATHVANEGLSAAEIVELMRQESEQLGRAGRGAAI
ncbi:DUF2732 family protein [Ewingella americana]|nr:DUF2732 family protein [Ewingella americana]KAA8727901.1 DUF2732 family protein [Ewingella americana]